MGRLPASGRPQLLSLGAAAVRFSADAKSHADFRRELSRRARVSRPLRFVTILPPMVDKVLLGESDSLSSCPSALGIGQLASSVV